MNPHQYGVWEGTLDAKSLSTLTILARAIQKMANLTTFSRDREPHLHLINDFIKTNSRNLALFVAKIIENPEKEIITDKQSKPTINVAKDASSLVQYFNLHIDAFRKYEKDNSTVRQLFGILKKINADTNHVKQHQAKSSLTTSVDENDINASNSKKESD